MMRGRGRPPRRGRRGRGAVISAGPTNMPSVQNQRPRTLNPTNAEDIVDWLTQDTQSSTTSAHRIDAPSSSCSASVPSSQVTTLSLADDNTTTTITRVASIDPSEELFSDDLEEISDAQPLLPEDVDNRVVTQSGRITHMDVQCDDADDVLPAAASFAELSDTSEALKRMMTMCPWMPRGCPLEEKKRGKVQRGRQREGGDEWEAGGVHRKELVAQSDSMSLHPGSARQHANLRMLLAPPECHPCKAQQCGIFSVCLPLITAMPFATCVKRN